MHIEIIRCDKCKDVIQGPIYNFTGPYNRFDLCSDCNVLLSAWLNGSMEENTLNGIEPVELV